MAEPRQSSGFFGWGRLKEGVTVEQARSEIQTIAARLEKTYPETNAGLGAVVKPLLDSILGSYRTNLALLLCAVALVLFIACANLANLFAARGASRSREFAIPGRDRRVARTRHSPTTYRKFLHRAPRRRVRLSVRSLGT